MREIFDRPAPFANSPAQPPADAPLTAAQALAQWLERQWAVPAIDRRVEVAGAAIAYRGWNLAATDLPGLLLVHGFRAHSRWWDHIAPSLAATHRVAAIDLSGMGDSDRRAAYSRALYGREMLAVAADCGFDPVTLVAHSFGALGAILASIAAPERVRRLVIVDTALPLPADVGRPLPGSSPRLYPDREAALARFRLEPPGGWPDPAIREYIAQHSLRETAAGWTWKFDENIAASLNEEAGVYRDTLFGVPVATDVVFGMDTEIMNPERRAMAAAIAPRCGPPIAIPCAHHHIMVEQPIALVAALTALLAVPR